MDAAIGRRHWRLSEYAEGMASTQDLILEVALAMEILSKKTYESPASFVFTLDGGAIRANWLTHGFKKYVRRKVDDCLKFHNLRASFASWLVIEGIDIFAVSKLLGHSDVKITQKHYAHLRPETLRNELNTISQILGGTDTSTAPQRSPDLAISTLPQHP